MKNQLCFENIGNAREFRSSDIERGDTYIMCASLDMSVFCIDALVVTIAQTLMWILKKLC